MGGCPCLGTYYNTALINLGTRKDRILTTTHRIEARKLEHDIPHVLGWRKIRDPRTNPPKPYVPTFWDSR